MTDYHNGIPWQSIQSMSEPSLDDWLWPVRIISNNSKFDKTSMKENAPTE